MTKEITELLEYLHKHWESSGKFKEWATAVEQLDKDSDMAIEMVTKLQAKVEAYERILDKGLTVNVYDPNGYKHRGKSGLESVRISESEDKVEKPFDIIGTQIKEQISKHEIPEINRDKSDNSEAGE